MNPTTLAGKSRSYPHDIASLFGEYAALAHHPGEDSDRLALAIRVVEALQCDARDADRRAQYVMPTR